MASEIPLRNIWILFLYAADLVQLRGRFERDVERAVVQRSYTGGATSCNGPSSAAASTQPVAGGRRVRIRWLGIGRRSDRAARVAAPLEQQRTCREAYFHLQGALYVAAGL